VFFVTQNIEPRADTLVHNSPVV